MAHKNKGKSCNEKGHKPTEDINTVITDKDWLQCL